MSLEAFRTSIPILVCVCVSVVRVDVPPFNVNGIESSLVNHNPHSQVNVMMAPDLSVLTDRGRLRSEEVSPSHARTGPPPPVLTAVNLSDPPAPGKRG